MAQISQIDKENVVLEGLHARLVEQGARREAQELRGLLDAVRVFDPEHDGQTRFLFFPDRNGDASAPGTAGERRESEFAAVTILRGGQSLTLPRAHLRAFVGEHLVCVVPAEAPAEAEERIDARLNPRPLFHFLFSLFSFSLSLFSFLFCL